MKYIILVASFLITISCFADIKDNLKISSIKKGDRLPAFVLYDQNDNLITHNDLLGNILVINFIFTRCNKADMCPRSMKLMVELQRLCRESLIKNVHFVTFSFDPQNDTPAVLDFYGHSYNVDFNNYSFLTGDANLIEQLTQLFGIYTIYGKKDDISHTMRTVIFDRTGQLVYSSNLNNWSPQKFLSIIKKIQKR